MLQLKEGKFHAKGISFALPDGFYLDISNGTVFDRGITLYTPDQEIQISINIEEDKDVKEGLEFLFSQDSSFVRLSEIRPVLMKGLSGYDVLFRDNKENSYEVHLAGQDKYVFILYAVTYSHDAKWIVNHPDFKICFHQSAQLKYEAGKQ